MVERLGVETPVSPLIPELQILTPKGVTKTLMGLRIAQNAKPEDKGLESKIELLCTLRNPEQLTKNLMATRIAENQLLTKEAVISRNGQDATALLNVREQLMQIQEEIKLFIAAPQTLMPRETSEPIPLKLKIPERKKRQPKLGTVFETQILRHEPETLPPPVEIRGTRAVLHTNEKCQRETLTRLRKEPQPPNGYLIGPGVGNVFNLLEAFPEDSPPKAIISIDIEPSVILKAKLFRRCVEKHDNFDSFLAEYFSKDFNSFVKLFREAHQGRQPRRYQRFLDQVNLRVRFRQHMRLRDQFMRELQRGSSFYPPEGFMNVPCAIQEYYKTIKKLVDEGNFAIVHSSIINPKTLEIINSLPSWQESNNIVYVSNIIDHLTRRWRTLRTARAMDALATLNPHRPHKNFFIDTSEFPHLVYQLRISREPPTYSEKGLQSYKEKLQAQAEEYLEKQIRKTESDTTVIEPAMRVYQISRDIYSPIVIDYMTSILQEMQQDGDSIVLCLGRDGLPMFLALRKLMTLERDLSPKDLLKRVQYVSFSRKAIIDALSPEQHQELCEQVSYLTKDSRYKKPNPNFAEQQDLLREYLAQAGVDQAVKIILFDSGLSGTTQNVLKLLYPEKNIQGRYLISEPRKDDPEKRNKRGFLQDPIFHNRKAIYFLEDLWSGIYSTTDRFRRKGKTVIPERTITQEPRPKASKRLRPISSRLILKKASLLGLVHAVNAYYFEKLFKLPQAQREEAIARLKDWTTEVLSPKAQPLDLEILDSIVKLR